ncbi:MAG: Trm112 family protein [Deltaproteobacteria bacterium]|nr:MAG: Trm112 family protein [Deltaproteobacteria bacterium]
MALSAEVLEILVCPKSRGPLVYIEEAEVLYSPEAGLKYRIEDGIPVLLIEEAEPVTEAEARAWAGRLPSQ